MEKYFVRLTYKYETQYTSSGYVDWENLAFNQNDCKTIKDVRWSEEYNAFYTHHVEKIPRSYIITDIYNRIVPPSEIPHVKEWSDKQKVERKYRQYFSRKWFKSYYRRPKLNKNYYAKILNDSDIYPIKNRKEIRSMFLWDRSVGYNSRSWKDQSKKRKQWM